MDTATETDKPDSYVECEFKALYTRLTQEYGAEEMWLMQTVVYTKAATDDISEETKKWWGTLPETVKFQNLDEPFVRNRFELDVVFKDGHGQVIKRQAFEPSAHHKLHRDS